MRKRLRWVLLAIVGVFFLFVLLDSLNLFHQGPYLEIPHGDHVHYVPHDRDQNVPIGQFPTRRPGPNEYITPRGEIVQIEEPLDQSTPSDE
jgi:hypothetical protein